MGNTVSEKRWQQDKRCRLITVYDMNKREGDKQGAYRRINLDGVLVIKLNGVSYRTTDAYKTIEEIERMAVNE